MKIKRKSDSNRRRINYDMYVCELTYIHTYAPLCVYTYLDTDIFMYMKT